MTGRERAVTKILFICSENSARSQMAEAYVKLLDTEGQFEKVESAGLTPTQINPLVVEVMREEGVDLSAKGTQSVFELFRQGRLFDLVVTVCDAESDARCPIFPGVTHRMNVPFPDPAQAQGTHEEQLAQVRVVRDQIKVKVQELVDWCRAGCVGPLV